MTNNAETNLEKFIDILIKMVESNEKRYCQGIDEIKTIVNLQNETHKKEIYDLKQSMNKCEDNVDNIKSEIGLTAIHEAVKNANGKLKNKFFLAAATLMVAVSPIVIKFNKEIVDFILKHIK